MPTLHWVGKDKVVNHHHDVPFRVLNKVSTFTAPAGLPVNSTDNRIIHGDNLEALKSLLPEFDRDNTDSELKLKLGKLWEAKAGRLAGTDYRYMMVFENNPIDGA